jgi:hypothetical protein
VNEFAQLLAAGDVDAVVAAWAKIFPNDTPPASRGEAEVTMHFARTVSAALIDRQRAWSHRWLLDHGWPSGLPDDMLPRAERLYPRAVEAVGIGSAMRLPTTVPLRAVMEEQVQDSYATSRILRMPADERAALVSGRMLDARAKERRKLLGV